MLVELHAKWEREDEMARNMKVCTITTSSNVVSNASNPLTLIGVEKTPTPCATKPKTTKTFSTKSAEIFRSMEDNSSTSFNDFDVSIRYSWWIVRQSFLLGEISGIHWILP
jgi:hypothetical protein